MAQQFRTYLLFLGFTLLLCSCGNESTTEVRQFQRQQDDQGTYQVELTPLGGSGTGGQGIIIVNDEIVNAELGLTGATAGSPHLQAISYSPDCQEAPASYLFALDQEITSDGSGTFPEADIQGNYQYQGQRSWEGLVEDLRLPDMQENDQFINLQPGERINLGGKTLWILVDERPVACGVITRL